MIFTSDKTGFSHSHTWVILESLAVRRWYVIGMGDFTCSGYAVVDDFGNLVEVPK